MPCFLLESAVVSKKGARLTPRSFLLYVEENYFSSYMAFSFSRC